MEIKFTNYQYLSERRMKFFVAKSVTHGATATEANVFAP